MSDTDQQEAQRDELNTETPVAKKPRRKSQPAEAKAEAATTNTNNPTNVKNLPNGMTLTFN